MYKCRGPCCVYIAYSCARTLDEYYYYNIILLYRTLASAMCFWIMQTTIYRRGRKRRVVFRVQQRGWNRIRYPLTPVSPPTRSLRVCVYVCVYVCVCVCVRASALYFGRSSRRKRVGEISSDNGSSFRCVRATMLLCIIIIWY